MAKEKRISELPGITTAAVVGLNRAGITTLHDLLAAEFDRVAYFVEDYNEAARLVKEARRISDGGRRSRHAEPNVPSPLSQTPPPSTSRHHSRAASQPATPAPAPAQNAPEPTGDPSGMLASAFALATRGVSLAGPSAAESRTTFSRQLEAVRLLLAHGAAETEIAAALLLEPAEAGAMSAEDVDARCGHAVTALLEECGALRAVPVLPSGKAPKYYLEMAASSSREARRICAATLVAAIRPGGNAVPGGEWHALLLVDALQAGGPDELVAMARTAVDGLKRSAA